MKKEVTYDEGRKIVKGWGKDFLTFAPHIKIKDEFGKLIPFKLNESQLKVHEAWKKQAAEGKPVRLNILKARKLGVSTYTSARLYHKTSLSKGITTLAVAHEPDATQKIFDMYKRCYNSFDEMWRPATKYSSKKELMWSKKEGGVYIVSSYKKEPRTDTVQNIHNSEVAFYQNTEKFMTAELSLMNDVPGTVIVNESTANGMGDWWYQHWQKTKAGMNDYVNVFIPWFENSKNRIHGMTERDLRTLDQEEKDLLDRGIDFEQLAWRRAIIRNKCFGSILRFHQEYPASDTEAFLSTGTCPFDTKRLVLYEESLREAKPIRKGYLRPINKANLQEWLRNGFVEDPNGGLSIYKEPDPDFDEQRYGVGGDPAEGLEHGDNSCAHVGDRKLNEQVAEFAGKADPERFAHIMYWLGATYNWAQLCPEANNHGHTVIKTLVDLEYPNIYMSEQMDKFYNEKKTVIGFKTTSSSRPMLIDEAAKAFRDGYHIRSYECVNEMLSFQEVNGKFQAVQGTMDDRVLGFGLFIKCSQDMGGLKVSKRVFKEKDYVSKDEDYDTSERKSPKSFEDFMMG